MDQQGNVLQRVLSSLKGYFGGTTRTPEEKIGGLSGFFNRFSSGREVQADTRTQPEERPTILPTATPAPDPLQQQISGGISRFGDGQSPIATLSGELAQSGQRLNQQSGIDPLLPTILALMESRGLLDSQPAQLANPYNIMYDGSAIDYEGNPGMAILGGVDSMGDTRQGFTGLLRPPDQGGLYGNFLESGDLRDFFTQFTPPSDPLNPSTDQLIERYNSLRSLFTQEQ